MKKLVVLLLVAVLCVGLCPGVYAQSGIQTMDSRTVVHSNGTCDVDLTVTLLLEEDLQPVFPIPADATDISINSQKPSLTSNGSYKMLSLSGVTGNTAGVYTFYIHYSLPYVVDTGETGLELTLPLLCGFAYPVEDLTFSVTLPGEITGEPSFFSSYYQELISAQMSVTTNGNTLSGYTDSLKDHETLALTLPVPDEMFPQRAVTARVMGLMDWIVFGFVLLAVVYFLLTMRPQRIHREHRTTVPDGVTPGELQMWLTGSGVDLSLLVVAWAQLGYLRIQVDDDGRVLLHKRMEMGNERNKFENRCFRNLFGPRRVVDGTGYHYAQLCRSLWGKAPKIKDIYQSRSGNPKIFRVLGLISGMLSGSLLAAALAPHSLFLKVLLSLVTLGLSIGVQACGSAIPKRDKLPVMIGGGCALVWMLLGILANEVPQSFFMLLFQVLVGLAAVYGGKRTDLGHQIMEQIFNLRRHIRTTSNQDMVRLLKGNPNYFHEVAPYALALGMDRKFARHFDRQRLQECNFLIVGNRRQMKASEWAKALRSAVETLDAKAKRLPLERFTRK